MKTRWSPLGAAALLALLGAALPAHATEYWTNGDLLADFFQTAKNPRRKVRYKPFTLSDPDAIAIGKKLGTPVKKDWNAYIADEGDPPRRVGFALLDQELGLHEPINFGVQYGLSGAVERVEITVYREAYGDQVRKYSFRRQFVGKTAADPIEAGQDIAIVTGASISSASLARGVKRDTLVLQAALKAGL
jgi:Na+-translocating ferredoxin:NAD+ oxidoreductase subunit G